MTAFPFELFAERGVILNDAVVHECDFSALVEMRMRIFVGHLSVGRPAGVTNAIASQGRLFRHQFREIRDTSGAFSRLNLFAVYDGDAGGIVTAIFKAPQTIKKNGRRFRLPDVADNSTHKFRSESIAYSARL